MDVEVSTGQNVMFVIITVFHVYQSDCWSIRNSVKHISKNKQCKYLNNTGTYISKKNTTLDTNRLFLKRKIFVQGRLQIVMWIPLYQKRLGNVFVATPKVRGKNLEESFLIKIFYAKHTDSGNRENRFIALQNSSCSLR